MMDLHEINQSFDLLGLVDSMTSLKHSGAWWLGPCPFCGGNDRFNLKQTPDGWRWFCRHCGDGKYHTTVDFALRLYPGESIPVALRYITGKSSCEPTFVKPKTPSRETMPDQTMDMQPIWRRIIDYGQDMLWSSAGNVARDYLHKRGFLDVTLHSVWHRIGWSEGRKIDGVWVERGILLPNFRVSMDLCVGTIASIKIRRLPNQVWIFKSERQEKYRQLPKSRPGIYNMEWMIGSDVIIVTEGELDTLTLYQEAKTLVGACTFGSASNKLDVAQFGVDLIPVQHILLAYDNDQAGEQGAVNWRNLGGRVKLVHVPHLYKDINEYHCAGGDVAGWVMDALQALQIE